MAAVTIGFSPMNFFNSSGTLTFIGIVGFTPIAEVLSTLTIPELLTAPFRADGLPPVGLPPVGLPPVGLPPAMGDLPVLVLFEGLQALVGLPYIERLILSPSQIVQCSESNRH